uniref:Uncharacterized protein n=1 Tax=Panagrolaimus sp. JU765 TaxID=591449 RepID=A0AC34RIC1_9BILA
MMISFLNLIAYSTIFYFGYQTTKRLFYAFYPFFIASKIDLHKLAGTNWAVITGSTDGIGKVYALELAKQGFDIILISRTQSRLETTKNEIIENYPKIKVEMIVFDFCQDDVKVYNSQLFEKLKKIDIGILVNNVGMAYDYPDILHEVHGGI